MAHPDNAEEIQKLETFVDHAEAIITQLGIVPRVAHRYPFDSVALCMVSKAFALSRSSLLLLKSNFPDEAYGLSRTLVECAINLRFLTYDPALKGKRTNRFVEYFRADKSYWLYYALEVFAGEAKETEILAHAKSLGIDPDTRAASRHWSSEKEFEKGFVWKVAALAHPLDSPEVTENQKKLKYAVDYHQTSLYVHCSQPALDNYFFEPGAPFEPQVSSGNYKQPSQATLYIILTHLYSLITYLLFGLNVDRPAALDELFKQTIADLKPVRVLHTS